MLIFYNTYAQIGGAENLIFSLMKKANLETLRVGLIGSDKGYLYERLINEKIQFTFINYKKINEYTSFSENDILILFGNFYGIESLKKFPGKICIWGILYTSITTWNRFVFEKNIFKKNIISHFINRYLIKKLFNMDSLFAMDGNVKTEINNYLNKNLNIPIIQIPVCNIPSENKFLSAHKNTSNNIINITYIARGEDIWKIKPLKKIVNDLKKLKYHFRLHVFTNDDYLYKKELNSENIIIKYYYNIYGNQLDNMLLELSDIHFSMGTSALEASKLGIPTILMDASLNDFPTDYKYNWLFNSIDYNLGSFIKNPLNYKNNYSLEQILNELSSEEQLKKISHLSLNYTKVNHSIDDTFEKLMKIKPEANITDILKYTPSSWSLKF